jgi:O-antigen/teichoic acid export membrane protein
MLATMVISEVLLQAFFPLIARLATTDSPRFSKTCTTLNRYLLAGGAYLAVAFFVFAAELIRLAFGAAYAAAVPALEILALAVLFNFLCAAPAVALIALGRQATRARASLFVLAFNAAVSFILIPGHGAIGAALATLAAFVMYAALNTAFVHRETGRFFFDRRSLATAGLALAGGIALVLLKGLSLPLGLAAYALLGGVLFLAATSREEKAEMLLAVRPPGGIPPEVEP